jgi:hypothetical protein
MSSLDELLAKARVVYDAMSPAEREEMHRKQRESWVRAEMSWPKAKFKSVDGAKVYDSFEDYCND